MSLESYNQKRNFNKTKEPPGQLAQHSNYLFAVQKHAASRLHYDFRLELNGVLKSWAIPKGPCLDPTVKRLAIHVEDHPIAYGNFEGIIPKGEYGGGTVMLWDKGFWQPLDKDPIAAYHNGHLRFELKAQKLKGRWSLIHFDQENSWFLIKHKDNAARPLKNYDITLDKVLSVLSERSMDEIALHYQDIWTNQGQSKPDKLIDKTLLNLGIKAPMPSHISVQLATLVDKPPSGNEWLHEIKFDGYRMLAIKNGHQVSFKSRNGKDWTQAFHNLGHAIQHLPFAQIILDGEIVLLDEQGKSNFQLLQNAMQDNENPAFQYFLFDLLYLNGYDLRCLRLQQRKQLLSQVLEQQPSGLHYSDHIISAGNIVFKRACALTLEGIVSKKAHSTYTGKRTKTWLKVKCIQRQEFIVGGFTKPRGNRKFFGALLLGMFNEHKELTYTGNVGGGFTELSLKNIYDHLVPLIESKNPFNVRPPNSKTVTWVKPKLIIDVEFTEWTKDNRLRHPVFKGLRNDVSKKPQHITKEKKLALPHSKKSSISKKRPIIKLSNANKVLYKEDQITKQDLYNYYDTISDFILPFIANRILTLVRCPETYTSCFYQKHLKHAATSLYSIPITNKEGAIDQYLYLKNKEGLLSLVQMGVLEIHPWGSKINQPDYPDTLIFDLDPGEDLKWPDIVAAAFIIKEALENYQLSSFIKTTGGKGLHIVLPIEAKYNWEIIKNFTQVFVKFLEQRYPKKFIAKMTKKERKGKIFVDYLRNQQGATAIAPYSTRARIHAPVATPLAWSELSKKQEDNFFTIVSLPKRLQRLQEDPWENFTKIRNSLTKFNLI